MKNVHIEMNFAPQPSGVSSQGLGFLVIAFLLFGLSVAVVSLKYAENSRQERLIATVGNNARSPIVKPTSVVRVNSKEVALKEFLRQTSRNLEAPWSDLLASLEAAPADVALLSIEPSASKRSISLTAEAAGPDEMLNYLQALQVDKRFTNVVLVSHQIQLQASGTPLRFQLRASWGGTP